MAVWEAVIKQTISQYVREESQNLKKRMAAMASGKDWSVTATESVWLTRDLVAVKTKDGRWLARKMGWLDGSEGGELRPLTPEEELLLAEHLFKEKSA